MRENPPGGKPTRRPEEAGRAVKQALQEVGAEKILMGTDSPWGRYELSIMGIKEATNDPSEQKLIMGGNIQRLLGV